MTAARASAPDGRGSGRATAAAVVTDQSRLVHALAHSTAFGAAAPAKVIETHISYVLLTGTYAYKIKKAVDFDFLDFRTIAARRFFCEEELRLNRRLAPALYLDVVPITGSADKPCICGSEPALEYAVKMREFPQDSLASRLLERGELGAVDIDSLAARVAAFHGAIGIAATDDGFGAPERILRLAQENFVQLAQQLTSDAERDELEYLRSWTGRAHAARYDDFLRRRAEGFVRECHGDLHLGNVARIDGELVIFDGIEFNEEMRWIDVMSEVAFTVMDLQDRARDDLAHRFLNAYLERTGDYGGLAVLPFYLAYRALVRAKIARLRAAQVGTGAAKDAAIAESRGYLELARRYAEQPRPALIVTCGLSGCGKTAISQALLEAIGAVRVRSDIERKRLHGIAPLERCDAPVGQRLYAEAATDATYDRLRKLARDILGAGRIAIVDATFLRHVQRESFRTLAMEVGIPFLILAFEASEATLRQRITQRQAGGGDASDADLAVLAHEIAIRELLTADERAHAVAYDAEAPLGAACAPAAWVELAGRLAGSPALRKHSR